tara:strand:- start:311 stop:943 length:633 start_codon:yes stop_codon:yes gene_type:complete
MILNKYYFLVIIILFLSACEDGDSETVCDLDGINTTIEATSFTEWKYFEVSDSGFIELDWMPDSIAQNSYDWDIAMMRNHFRTNSGLSGPGDGGAFMIDATWDCELFNTFSQVPDNAIFIEDGILTNIYQPWAHDDPDEAYTEDEGSTVLENWGWFDIDDSYYFYYTHKQFIVKLPNDKGYIKLWPYQYYGDLGESAHTTLIYDFIIPPE